MADQDLFEAALRVADGAGVDWRRLGEHSNADDRPVVAALEKIDALARVHAADSAASPPGVRWGPLEIIERIGSGAFGDVYRARDPRLGRDVALKLLRTRDTDRESALVHEAHLLARVRHPGIVTVYGAERIDGTAGLWMELVPGETLAAELDRRGRLPEAETLRVGVELADALAAVHEAGLLHRDIKPQNVMRAEDGRVLLMDFGTGHETVDRQHASILAGTPLYVAPEVLAGEPATVRSDVYSLGVLLWRSATGEVPARGSTLHEIRTAHLAQCTTRRPPAGVTTRLGRVLSRAVSLDPLDRYATAAALGQALVQVQQQAAGRRRQRRLAGLAVAAGAVIPAMVWIAGNGQSTDRPGTPPPPGLRVAAGIAMPLALPDEPVPPAVPTAPIEAFVPASAARPLISGVHPSLHGRATLRHASNDPLLATCSPVVEGALALCNLATGEIRVLKAPAGVPRERVPAAVLSPDLSSVAYLWSEGAVGSGRWSLRVMAADGTRDRELVRVETPGHSLGIAAWMPSGDAILAYINREMAELVMLPVDGRPSTLIHRGPRVSFDAAISPEGRRLLLTLADFTQPDPHGRIVIRDLASGTEHEIAGTEAAAYRAIWAPDGRGVVYASRHAGLHRLVLQDVSGLKPRGSPQALAEFGRGTLDLLGFAADGGLLLGSRDLSIWTVQRVPIDLSTGRLGFSERLGSASDIAHSGQWNPRDGTIASIVGPTANPDGLPGIQIRASAGPPIREMPFRQNLQVRSRLRWSPDGERLAVIHARDPRTASTLTILRARTGVPLTLSGSIAPRDIHWADDDHLLVSDGRTVERVEIASGTSSRIYTARQGASIDGIARGRDRAVAVIDQRGSTGGDCRIRIVREADVREAAVFEKVWCEAIEWSQTGRYLLIATAPQTAVRSSIINIVDLERGTVEAVKGPDSRIVELSLSPDERDLLLTTGDPRPQYLRVTGIVAARDREREPASRELPR